MPNLLDLVGLAFIAAWLQVQNFSHFRAHEDVVVAPDAFRESQAQKQVDHAREGNIGIGIPSEDLFEKLFGPRHGRAQD